MRVVLHIVRRDLVRLRVLLMSLLVCGVCFELVRMGGAQTAEGTGNTPLISAEVKVGAWGRLAKQRVLLSAPKTNIDRAPRAEKGNPWRFSNKTPWEVEAFLHEAGMDRNEVGALMATSMADIETMGVQLTPTPNQVAGLTPTARGVIYHELACYPHNWDQGMALHFSGESTREWLEGVGLAASTIDLVDRYAYRDGVFVVLADLKPIRQELNNEAEYDRLLRGLFREKSWEVWLEIEEGAEIEGLTSYWGRDGREKEVGAIFEAASRKSGGGRVGLSDLLPGFPRALLNQYNQGDHYKDRDCHWFGVNFFFSTPADHLDDRDSIFKWIGEHYDVIDMDELAFGDLVTYSESQYGLHHTAVYIADGLVMTKNGSSLMHPYMLMSLEEMGDYYPSPDETTVMALRLKENAEAVSLR